MAEQLEMMFNEGGMKDSAMTRDPVSGNDIPPGSTAKEVRDDVEANLSEGEYVLPADVVQFLGLDKIEKMVTKAQEQLAELDAKGRIGGEKPGGEDDLPFSDEELETVEDGPTNMAEGGLVEGTFNPSAYSYGGGGITTRMYVNAEGVKRPFVFVNGQPATPIPEGFVPDDANNPYKAQQDPTTATEDLSTKTTPEGPPEDRAEDSESGKSFAEFTSDDFSDFAEQTGKGLGLASAIAPVFAGPLGFAVAKGIEAAVGSQNKAALAEINARLAKDDLDEQSRTTLEAAKQSIEEGSKDSNRGGGLLGGFDLGEKVGGFFGQNDSMGRGLGVFDGDGLIPDLLGALGLGRKTGKTPTAKTQARTPAPNPQGTPASETSSSASDPNPSHGSQNDGGPGNMAKGGLVSKKASYKKGGLVKRR